MNCGWSDNTAPFCRLCAHKSENYVDIFSDEGQRLNLTEKIEECLHIWLFPEDILPKTICLDCCDKVEQYYCYFTLCSQSQASLMQILSSGQSITSPSQSNLELVEIKPPTDESVESPIELSDIEGADDNEITESNVECVISEKGGGTSKRKLRTPVKHQHSDEEEVKTSNFSNERQTRPERMTKPQNLKEESIDLDDDIFEEYSHINNKVAQLTDWECTNCDLKLQSLVSLKAHHHDVHNQAPKFKCPKCGKIYDKYRSYSRHFKLHGHPKKFSCEKCGKSFSQKTVLLCHRTVHSEERPHVCAQCGKAFKQFSSLYLHSKCHLPDKAKPKYPCSICGKEFSAKHSLDTHFKIHTGEKNYTCDVCGKGFVAKGSLDYHMMTHNELKPHSCEVCGKGFKTSRLLSKHATVHTGLKPHQCDVCGKQFREKGALREHNRIHTGAMPYSCEYCGKLFRFKGILTVHRRQHTGERPYSCGECNREFTNWANYNKHMKRRHKSNEPVTQRPSMNLQTVPLVLPNDQSVQTIVQPIETHQEHPSYISHSDGLYKLPEHNDHEIYRVPSYVPTALQLGTVNYYIPPINNGVLHTDQ